ncbi:MAG: nucleoside-diphosphate sugar epimerase/dehydratase, partial [Spirochaetota bacterium]
MLERILIVGAGEAGRILVSEFVRQNRSASVIGFIDDDLSKKGQQYSGKAVLGSRSDIRHI